MYDLFLGLLDIIATPLKVLARSVDP